MDPCTADQERVAGECVTEFEVTAATIRLNSVGFLPDRVKLASVPTETLDPGTDQFVVRRADDDAEVFRGEPTTPLTDRDSGELVWIADFSELSESGDYYLEAPGIGVSPRFSIGPEAYAPALEAVFLGLHGQRCGGAVDFDYGGWRFTHEACHLSDGSLEFVTGTDEIQPATGGWHDAGDYGKYTVNGAFALGMVLQAWEHSRGQLEPWVFEIPESGGPLPDYLAEAKWQLDWLLGMQFEDGGVAHKLSGENFAGTNVMPEEDNLQRYLSPAGTTSTADFTGAVAQAVRVYEPYDAAYAEQLREAALRGYAYLKEHPSYEPADMSAFNKDQYQNPDNDDRIWAAAEVWESTGDADALADFEGRVSSGPGQLSAHVQLNWDWTNTANLALFTYALSEREGRDPGLVTSLEQALLETADAIVSNTAASRYGRGLNRDTYYWGINGVVARTALNLRVAYLVSGNEAYLDALVQQIDHLLGRNPLGRSMVTGLGHHPPVAPHHRPSRADALPPAWPGLLVGGPHPTPTSYMDRADDYATNEVAINWNAALLYALACAAP